MLMLSELVWRRSVDTSRRIRRTVYPLLGRKGTRSAMWGVEEAYLVYTPVQLTPSYREIQNHGGRPVHQCIWTAVSPTNVVLKRPFISFSILMSPLSTHFLSCITHIRRAIPFDVHLYILSSPALAFGRPRCRSIALSSPSSVYCSSWLSHGLNRAQPPVYSLPYSAIIVAALCHAPKADLSLRITPRAPYILQL